MVGRYAAALVACGLLGFPLYAAHGFVRSAEKDVIRSIGTQDELRSIPLHGAPVRVSMDVHALRGTRLREQRTALEATVTVELPANAQVLSVQRHEGAVVAIPRNTPRMSAADLYTVTFALPREVVTQTFNFGTLHAPGWELPRGFVRSVLWRTQTVYDVQSTPFPRPASRMSATVERGDYAVIVDVLEAGAATDGSSKRPALRYALTVLLPPGCSVIGVQRHEGVMGSAYAQSEVFTATLQMDGALRTHTFDFTGMVAGDWVLAPTGLDRIHWRSRP